MSGAEMFSAETAAPNRQRRIGGAETYPTLKIECVYAYDMYPGKLSIKYKILPYSSSYNLFYYHDCP